jgi:hypothetical protein
MSRNTKHFTVKRCELYAQAHLPVVLAVLPYDEHILGLAKIIKLY